MPEAAFEILEFVFEASMAIAQLVRWNSGLEDPTGDTQIVWGQLISGTGSYYYVDANGAEYEKTGNYYFNTSISDGYALIVSEDFTYSAVSTGATGSAPYLGYVQYGSGAIRYDWNPGAYYRVSFNGASPVSSGIVVSSEAMPTYVYGNMKPFYLNNSSVPPALYLNGVNFTTYSQAHDNFPDAPYLDIQNKNLSYNEINENYLLDWANTQAVNQNITNDDGTQFYFTINDLYTWGEANGETETETETVGGTGGGDTYIYVNADGSLTLNNDISGDMPINIDNNADLSLTVNAAAGAFGAGAIVIDPDANINLNAGAFGAGAFGAGAITGDINFSGDVTFEQSGEITNNYYYLTDPTEETEQPFTLDYDEILSEGELESILNQETYTLVPIETNDFTDLQIVETLPGEIQNLPAELVVTSNEVVNYGSQIVSDLGLTPVYAPLLVFSFVCYVLRGCA